MLPSIPIDWISNLESHDTGRRLLSIAGGLTQAGGRVILVGGAVRDGLRGEPSKDLDVEVFGLSLKELEAALAQYGKVIQIGRSFGVLMIQGLDVDFSLPRLDSKKGPGHRGFDVECDPTLSFEEASRRRDLTINSLGVDLATGELLDPHQGREDLEAGRLRATDARYFAEDPLRGLRAAGFAARFCMTPTPELLELCAKLDLSELPGERMGEEFRKLLCKGVEPSRGLAFLKDSGLLRFFPEIEALIGVDQDSRWHPEGDVWIHTLMALDRAAELRTGDSSEDEALMFATLCHDFGKPSTTKHINGRLRSHGHDEAGITPTRDFLGRLRMRNELADQVAVIVRHHLAPVAFVGHGAGARAYRKLARQLGEVGLSTRQLERVCRADFLGRTTPEAIRREFKPGDAFIEFCKQFAVDQSAPTDRVQGRHLIARGMSPSPRFSEILQRCRDVQDTTGWEDAEAILERALTEIEA